MSDDSVGPDSSNLERERFILERQRLRTERQKIAIDARLKRQEILAQTSKSWKQVFANPVTLAIVGAFLTLMTTIVSNYLTSTANVYSAKQTLQADLIKKFVESPKTQTVRDNLQFLVETGLVPDYGAGIAVYLKAHPDTAPQAAAPQPAPASSRVLCPDELRGFVVSVSRTREERSGDRVRTVGNYRVTFAGVPVAGLEGMTVESRGPGDNTRPGSVRLETGAYPLHTWAGANYVTFGYSPDEAPTARPKPAIGLGETGSRSGILIHPGSGFLTAIGTINLSKVLAGPGESIDYQDSRKRVIALIDAMKQKLTTEFPADNGTRIPNACVVITGEPVLARAD